MAPTPPRVQLTDMLPAGVSFVSATPSQGSYNAASGVWTVGTVNPGVPQTLGITGTVVSSTPQTNTGTISHADQFDPNTANNTASDTIVPCYCTGTLILTDRGEVPVETLAIGDKVMTADGAARLIRWIGRRSYSGRFARGNHVLPICIKAGALDENLPRRDLWISPNHAMFLHCALIEAQDLVNGVSIVRAAGMERVDYFHIELETHDIIVAEGALSESFVDDDSRGMFQNAHEFHALYPNEHARPDPYCAPRLAFGTQVEAARRQIARRAGIPYRRPTAESTPRAPRRRQPDSKKRSRRGRQRDPRSHARVAGCGLSGELPGAPAQRHRRTRLGVTRRDAIVAPPERKRKRGHACPRWAVRPCLSPPSRKRDALSQARTPIF
jgi:hypothetical protein